MLSDKLRKKLDVALDDYVLENINMTKDEIFNIFEKDITELSSDERSMLQNISHFTIQNKDHYLDQYRACETFDEFLEAKEKDTNRRFLFDLYTMSVGNLSAEQVEERYCNNEKKKGLK